MDDDEYADEPRGTRGFRPRRNRRQPEPEFIDDDGGEADRVHVADMMSTIAKTSATQMQTTAKSSSDMISLMLMTQQQAASARAEDDRRREDRAAEERKRQEEREEKRQEEREERREREERTTRAEDLRRAELEERRRTEDAENRRRDNERHLEAVRSQSEKDMKRTEMMLGAFTAALPVVMKLFEKKEDPLLAMLISKSNEKAEPDPMQMMLFKSILDKMNNDQGSNNMIAQMGELMKLSSTMSTEQMRSMMANSNEFNQVLMKKALDLATASGGEGGEKTSMMENIVKALAGASDIVKNLVPQQAPQPPPHAQQRRIAQQPHAPQTTQQAATQQTAPQADTRTPDELAYDRMTDEEKARYNEAQQPTGTQAVLWSLYSLQTKQYTNPAEYQGLIKYAVSEMPLELRVAVLDDDESRIMGIVLPEVEKAEQLNTWAKNLTVISWLREFVPQLKGPIQGIHGPAEKQREAFVESLSAPAPEATPEATQTAQVEENPLPMPEAREATVVPDDVPTTGSHLDPDAP